jgi:DNA protecting protein DprA
MSDSKGLRSLSFRDGDGAQDRGLHPMSSNWSAETRAFLALATIRGLGQKTLFALAKADRSFSDIIEHGLTDERVGQLATRHHEPVSAKNWSAIRSDALSAGDELAAMLGRLGVMILFRGDSRFPHQLLDLPRPPHWLFVQGAFSRLSGPTVTIVGTRKPSADGDFLARYVGACLGGWSVPTVSGLAIGVDRLAHEHSLRAGVPTIAVLGTGILAEYPKDSTMLRERILGEGGAIVTEYLPRISYSAENFVQRNRLQAALGRVLIPVEWSRHSGTAHTVRFASGLKRPIACLRLPEWPDDRVKLEPGLGLETGEVFTVPREQARFDRFVRDALEMMSPTTTDQLSLFGEG